jgi:tRNA dimethylallyltransferase
MSSEKPLVYCVFGPTACRKSEFALEIAEKLNAEIINCDSVQVYTEVQIGANKPAPDERERVKHHLLDFVEPLNSYTAGQFHRDFHEIIRKRSEVGVRVFVLVGGSGFYARAALRGLYPVDASDPKKREQLTGDWKEDKGRTLFHELLTKDPDYAKKIGPQDQRRVIRALEILRDSKFKTMAELEDNLKSQPRIFEYKQIALYREREDLRAKILERSKHMVNRGLIPEVKSLLGRGFRGWAPMRSVGYAEVVDFFDGKLSEKALPEEIAKNTSRLAKRQMTWLRSEEDLTWFHAETDWESALLHAQKEAASFV